MGKKQTGKIRHHGTPDSAKVTAMSILSLKPIKIASDDGTEDGLLVLENEALVAVLARLEHAMYLSDVGHWHLEAGFGSCAARPQTFATLEAALCWVAERMKLDVEAAIASALASFQPSSFQR